MKGLTRRQQEVLDFIRAYVAEHQYSPTFDEIADFVGLDSKSGVHRIVHGLVDRGAIRLLPRQARSIEIVQSSASGFFETLPESTQRAIKVLADSRDTTTDAVMRRIINDHVVLFEHLPKLAQVSA